jgi:hypothetical protein
MFTMSNLYWIVIKENVIWVLVHPRFWIVLSFAPCATDIFIVWCTPAFTFIRGLKLSAMVPSIKSYIPFDT